MTYDDEYDDERPVTTWRSVLRDFGEVLARPAVARATRAAAWWRRLRGFEIDWSGFAVTRGGFFDWLGTPLVYKPDVQSVEFREHLSMRLGRGLELPWQPDRWRPWAKWWVGFDWSFESYLPKITAQRGGIRLLPAPGPLEFRLPFEAEAREPDPPGS